MSAAKEWQEIALIFKELLNLETSPVGLACLNEPLPDATLEKARVCRAILEAAKGKTVKISRENNACFGAAWHLGFQQITDPKVAGMIKQFVVEGEKLFSSYSALDKLVSQMGPVPDNPRCHFLLAPLENFPLAPQLVIFVVNAECACRLLTLATFSDGLMPKIQIGGPTCRMAVVYPLLSGEVNVSFYDYTARKMCNVEKDKLLISIPYARIPQIAQNIERCTAGRAKIEYPQEFREFLQKRLARTAK